MTEPIEIAKLNLGGDGVGSGDQIVPRSLPGEQVSETGAILRPSVERVSPPCRHFKSCGGCALQHANDAFVASWKASVIRAGLAARGLECEIAPISTSPPKSRRRALLHGRRTKKGVLLGFHGKASGVLVEVPDCHLLDPEIISGFEALEALVRVAASRKGEVGLMVSCTRNGLDVDLRDAKPLDPAVLSDLVQLTHRFGLARLSWDGDQVVTRLAPEQSFDGISVTPPPGAFLQATQHGEDCLRQAVRAAIGDAKHVVDLFAGCGTFALPLARGAKVDAYEGDAALIEALDKAWRHADGLKHLHAEARDLFRRPLLSSEFKNVDAVVIDPPRAGAEAQCRELAKSAVPRIAFVSCNPVTFARDAAILQTGGYSLDWVRPVDQFRWSAHVELAAQLTKRHM